MPPSPHGAEALHESKISIPSSARFFHVSKKQSPNKTGRYPAFEVSVIKITPQKIPELLGDVFELGSAATNPFVQGSAHPIALFDVELQ